MNPVMKELLQIVETDPFPDAHTSSHWQLHAREITFERQGDELVLRGSWLGTVNSRGGPFSRTGRALERLSYRRVTDRLTSYPTIWKTASNLAHDLSFPLSFDVWRQSVALAVLVDHWAAYNLSPKTFAVIGDGHGFLGALIRRRFPQSKVYSIDLAPLLILQAHTHESTNPDATISVVSPQKLEPTDVSLVLPQDVEAIPDEIDCGINIASMQEMSDFSIASYFSFLRSHSSERSRFYCINRLRKELPGGEVTEFTNYPWRNEDEIFIDGPCPYYAHFFSRATLPKGPWVLGVRVPFVNHFDGIVMHRLARLTPL